MRHPLVAAALLLPLALTGCSGPSALVVHQRQGVAADPKALERAWSTPATQPGWLPADATRIRWIASTRGGADRAPAALEARSAADLPASCTPLEQPGGPAITASWTPSAPVAGVRRCGNWAVAAIDGGYSAWTPVAEASAVG